MDLQPIKDALGTLKRSNGQPKEGNDLAEAMDEFIGQVPTWLAQLVAEVERLQGHILQALLQFPHPHRMADELERARYGKAAEQRAEVQ